MLACRPRPHRLTALSSYFGTSPACASSSTSDSHTALPPRPADTLTASTDRSPDSIFTAPESPWDHVFSDIDPDPPALPTQRTRRPSLPGLSSAKTPTGPSPIRRASGVRRQRASLTAREMSVFDEMFDMIFNAVSGKDGKASIGGSKRPPSMGPAAPPSSVLSFAGQTPGIGRSSTPANDVFRTLRRHTSRVRWTTAIDEELDRKKETMELFNTDHDLFQWVMEQVFGEAQRWDEEATRAIAASSTTHGGRKGKDRAGTETGSTDAAGATSSLPSGSREHPINHSIYPHLIAHAMRLFRTTYSNPSLSLAIFHHAARVSIPSYVFGCTAPAYNELMEAKWEGWGDLVGVCHALEEMRANGVKIDGRTRIVVEKVRKEIGEARPMGTSLEAVKGDEEANHDTAAEDANPLARRVWIELGEAEVMRLLYQIERLALRDRSRKSTSSPHEESWKSAVLQPGNDDGWRFDGWEQEGKAGNTRKQRRMAKPMSRDEWNAPEHGQRLYADM